MAKTLDSETRAEPIIPIPFPPPIDEDTLVCLGGTEASSFTATPPSVEPFGAPVTLRWSVSVPSGCPVAIRLNGKIVSKSGSMQVQPTTTTRYTLVASVRGLSKTLRSITVPVNTAACVTVPVPESTVRTAVRDVVDAVVASSRPLSQRSAAQVEVVPGGITVALRLKADVPSFSDPDINIDFTLGLRIQNGAVVPFYRSFSVDVDWPWWVGVITLGASEFVEDLIEDKIENAAKPQILQAVTQLLEGLVSQLPGSLRLHSLQILNGSIRVTACPATAQADDRFMVLATGHGQDIDGDGDFDGED